MKELLCTEEIDWKGTSHALELYEATEVPNDFPVSQCQAIPFLPDGNVVLYKHIDGYFGLPGGQVESDELFEVALEREIMEECSCKVISSQLIGFIKDTNTETGEVTYQLRYVAMVEALDIPVNDPAGKAISRHIVPAEAVAELLHWGRRGEKLVVLATKYKNVGS